VGSETGLVQISKVQRLVGVSGGGITEELERVTPVRIEVLSGGGTIDEDRVTPVRMVVLNGGGTMDVDRVTPVRIEVGTVEDD